MAKVKIERKIHRLNVAGRPLGRVASEIAIYLRGKNKPEFEPHIDGGDIVEVRGVDKIKITGKKLEQKVYYHHSGYPGGLKETKLKDLMAKDPAEVLRRAVREMLPPVRFRKNMLKRLIIR